MDRAVIARKLVKLARQLTAIDPKALLDDLKYIQILWAEGDTQTGLPTLKGKKFPNVSAIEKTLNKFEPPDIGYDKCGILLVFKDGSQLKNFRYDHGEKDPSFSKQLNWYIENRVSITGSQKSADRTARKLTAGPYVDIYREIKNKVKKPGILLVKIGDFYEAFDDDAKVLAELTDAVLTKRKGIFMAGVSAWALKKALKQLKAAGEKVMLVDDYADYTAKSREASDSLIDLVLDQRKLGSLRRDMDEQTYDLMVDVYDELSKALELTRGQKEALNRLQASMKGNYASDMHRNNIFKAAHALGMKLPSMMF